MDLSERQLLELALDSASPATALPPQLWDRVAARTGSHGDPPSTRPQRHVGWSRPEPSGVSPLAAFIETAAEFGALLDSLSEADWRRSTRVEGAVVRDLAEHLVGMERYLLGQLGRGPALPADRREDHYPVTRRAAADMAGLPDHAVALEWWHEVMELVSACGELGPDHPVRYHHLAGGLRGLLVSRIFELWTHSDDIRQAVGLPFDLLDEGRLSLMVGDLMGVLPIGLALSGTALPGKTARFQVTGTGGGTFDVPLEWGRPAGDPDIVVTVDAIGLCRLAANRLDGSELETTVAGDESLLEPLLVGAGAFAAD